MACRNVFKLITNNRNLYKNIYERMIVISNRSSKALRVCPVPQKSWVLNNERSMIIGVTLLSWLGFKEEDDDKDSELIMTLKRAVLCMRKEQYDKAEQMCHLALRLAQQQQNQQGVIYCYDLMANLAMERFQLDKAEKLFVHVLQLLLGSGLDQRDLKVIHISLKLARISQLKAENEKADLGYKWCLEQIDKKRNDNIEAQLMHGIILDWYSQFLLDNGDVSKALAHLREAYEVCKIAKGQNSEQSMLLLNDLGTTSFRAGDIENAQRYLKQAISVGHEIDDKTHLGVIHANLGLILLERGIEKEAEKYCKEAWKLGKKHENNESVEQANYCFDQIKLVLGK